MRAQAAERTVLDLARGILMERLGCSAADASRQLAEIAVAAGRPPLLLAAEITGQAAPPEPGLAEPGLAGARLAGARLARAGLARAGPGDAGEPLTVAAALAGAAMELAEDGSGLARAMLAESLGAAGAVAVAIWLIAPDGAVELAGEAGFGPGEASRWQRMPPGVTALAERAARAGTEFWWPQGRPPADESPLIGDWDNGARAVIPLVTDRAGVIGALEVCWPTAFDDFAPPLRRQVGALARLTVQTLPAWSDAGGLVTDHRASWVLGLLDGLHESVLFAPAIRDDSGAVTDFRIVHVSQGFRDPGGRTASELAGQSLIEAYPAAVMPGGLYHRAVQVLSTGAPQHVSGEVIGTSGGGQAVIASVRIARLADGVVISLRHAAETERLAALLGHAQRLGRFGGWEENLATGFVHWTEPMFTLFGGPADAPLRLADLHTAAVPEDAGVVESFRASLLRDKTATAAVFRVVRRDDLSIRQVRAFAEPVTDYYGELVAVRGAYQDISTYYHTEMALAATRDLLSDSEERAEEEHRLALRLQQAITPQSSHLAEAAGLDVAARYRPAGQGHLVSGDWYDTVLLPSGQVMLVVGDVAGHGIDAVTGMVTLRNCLRGLAITGAGPRSLLSWLNSVACHLTDDILGTAICGLYDPSDRTLRWARAGHLPALLVRDARASLLPQPAGVLLGAATDVCYEEATTPLEPGDTLLMFTDGLIERKDKSIDECLEAMLEIASRPADDIDAYADQLVALAGSDTGDDACLVAVTLRR